VTSLEGIHVAWVDGDRARVLTALEGGTIVGRLRLVYAGPAEVELKGLAVATHRRRRGIGRMLVERARSEGRERGFTTMLVAAALETDVVRFYLRLGFRLVELEQGRLWLAAQL
jgi:ribosomal protein S18 acetylase RimI-like enzyme